MEAPSKIKRKQLAIAIGGFFFFIAVMVLGMWLSDPNRGKPTSMETQREKSREVMRDFTARSSDVMSAEETWITRSEKRLKALQFENETLRNRLDKIDRIIDEKNLVGREGTDREKPEVEIPVGVEIFKPKKVPQQLNASQNSTEQNNNRSLPQPPSQSVDLNDQRINPAAQFNTIQVVTLGSADAQRDEESKMKNVSHYLPTGSFATAVLLSGMDAPTGGQSRSQPVPVLLRVMDAGQLPNFWNSDVASCHVTGAAHGDISSERAHIRLEILSCVLINGDVIEEAIKGYVAGEDGKAGLRGRLVSKQGSLIAKSLLSGVASGMGNSISQQYQQVSTSAFGNVKTIDPNKTLDAGLAAGAGNALEKIADFYIARANEMYPIIEIDANRIGEIILLDGTDFGTNLIGNKREYDD